MARRMTDLRQVAEGRDELGTSPLLGGSGSGEGPAPGSAQVLPQVLGLARRSYSAGRVATASRSVRIETIDGTLRVFGPRAARSTVGLMPYVNIVRPENAHRILQSPLARGRGSLVTGGTALDLASNIVTNGSLLISGELDRIEFAAALTLDTGTTIASGLVGGFIAGAVSRFLVGGMGGWYWGDTCGHSWRISRGCCYDAPAKGL